MTNEEKCPACEGSPSRFAPDPCPVCGRISRGRRIAPLLAALAFYFSACVVDHSPRPCERLQHHTTTGHVVLCDCTCDDDERFACPVDAVCDASIEDDDWRWPEGSSSDDV